MEERIEAFLSVSHQDGYGYGQAYGFGDAQGDGLGNSLGHLLIETEDDGVCHTTLELKGEGFGYGFGYSGGYEHGCGYGDGCGGGIKSINGKRVHKIDGFQTILNYARGNVATGYVLKSDLTLTPCYVVKEGDTFVHGYSLRSAYTSLSEKIFAQENSEDAINKFRAHFPEFDKEYPAKDFFLWHHVLTGSCLMGREEFCREHGIDLENDKYTVRDFIELTKDAYGGETIRLLSED